MKHVLTINVEDYYQVGAFSHLIPYREWERFDDRLNRNLDSTLALLAEHDATATFFVSGWIAENHPELFQPILEAGHEIGSQGYYQQSIRGLPPRAFREDIRRSKQLLEAVTGHEVLGFRIGRGWIGPDDRWALDIIREEGFRYDASCCPLGRQFAGEDARFVVTQMMPPNTLIEVPVSSLPILGYALPFAGGNYLRQLPAAMTHWAMSRWTDELRRPLVAYFHIWELDRNQPAITAAGPIQKLRHYRNLDSMPARIARMLAQYRFESAREFLALDTNRVLPDATPPASATAQPGKRVKIAQGASRTSLTVIVPCYNEEASIPYLSRTLLEFSERSRDVLDLSYVFVDDGSSDTTWHMLETVFGTWDNVELVRLALNRGIGGAILAGVEHAGTDLVAVIDADCTFDPNQLVEMLPLMHDDVSAVTASPFHRQGNVMHVPGWRLLLSRTAAFLYRLVMHNKLTSYTSCFRIYRRAQISGMKIDNQGFCGVTEILARLDLAGHKVVETPAVLQVRLLGQSKIRLVRVTCDHLRLLGRIFMARFLGVTMR